MGLEKTLGIAGPILTGLDKITKGGSLAGALGGAATGIAASLIKRKKRKKKNEFRSSIARSFRILAERTGERHENSTLFGRRGIIARARESKK